jgi:hypothetical protein
LSKLLTSAGITLRENIEVLLCLNPQSQLLLLLLSLPPLRSLALMLNQKPLLVVLITDGGTYKGAQTEIRGGYETKVGTSGLKVYGEVGPGYEWNNGGTNEGVVVTEVGLSYPLAKQVSLKAKVAGEYGFDSEAFAWW